MVSPAILRHQLAAMAEDLAQAQHALAQVGASPWITHRVGHNYTNALEKRSSECLSLQERLDAGEDPGEVWTSLRDLRAPTSMLLREALAFIQGSLARGAGVGVQICDLADALLDDLEGRLPVRWKRFTVMAESEFVSGPADVIRLRFPEATVWSLPIIAHELGHYFTRERYEDRGAFGRTYPFVELMDSEHDPMAARQLDETIADVFATWTIGPVYGMTCLYLRFDPTSETDPWEDHPGDAERVEAILHALRCTATRVGGQAEIVARLAHDWEAAVAVAGTEAAALTPDNRGRVHRRVEGIVELLDEHLPADALYHGWRRAKALAPALAASGPSLDIDSQLAPWDVLNASWLRRLDVAAGDGDGMAELASRTVDLCWRRLEANR